MHRFSPVQAQFDLVWILFRLDNVIMGEEKFFFFTFAKVGTCAGMAWYRFNDPC